MFDSSEYTIVSLDSLLEDMVSCRGLANKLHCRRGNLCVSYWLFSNISLGVIGYRRAIETGFGL